MEVASLGQPANISLGGYIPAGPQRMSVARQALAAFLAGAAGSAGGKLIEGITTPDVSDAMMNDKTLQAEGMAPTTKRGAVAKFLAPTNQDTYDKAKQIAGTQQYQKGALAQETARTKLAQAEATNTAEYRKAELGERAASRKQTGEHEAMSRMQQSNEALQNFLHQEKALGIQEKNVDANAAESKQKATQMEILNRNMFNQGQEQAVSSMTKGRPPLHAEMIKRAAVDMAKEGKTWLNMDADAFQQEALQRAGHYLNTGNDAAPVAKPSLIQDIGGINPAYSPQRQAVEQGMAEARANWM